MSELKGLHMALGRGLSALIPEKAQESSTPKAVEGASSQELAIGLISDNRFQPRQNYDEAKLDELVGSIKEKGFLQPIVVRKADEGYEVIAGERRLKAARKLGLASVPVVIREASDKEALELALVENLQREDLNPVEKAMSYQRFIEEFSYTQEGVAKAIGKDRVTVANLLRILKLPDEIRKAIVDGVIAEGHARALVSIEDPNAQMVLFRETVQKGFSVREVEERAKKASSVGRGKAGRSKKAAAKDPELASLEEELRQILGTKVVIENKRGNKGRMVIEYYSLDDFDRILGIVRR
jgi:ParB family chromosome partitioning protein